MRVFITGASGFIGSHLTQLVVEAGGDVLALATTDDPLVRLENLRGKINLLRAGIGDVDQIQKQLRSFKPQACAHLAWYVEPGQYLHSPQNLTFLRDSLSLLEILVNVECPHVMMVGTCAEYDCNLGYLSEGSPTLPLTLYAASKLSLGLTGLKYAEQVGMNFVWARLFYIYGPKEDRRRLVPSLITTLKSNETFRATSGEQIRDYLYVSDVASALWFLMKHNLAGIFNICSGIPVRVKDLLMLLAEILGKEESIDFGAVEFRDWEPMVILGDNRKLRLEGWEPEIALREGLMRTVDWWTLQEDR